MKRITDVHRRRIGFTLVELLVVVAIIALLISILLPSLASAREQAKKIRCLANMKDLGTASQIYSNNDSQGILVPLPKRKTSFGVTGGSAWFLGNAHWGGKGGKWWLLDAKQARKKASSQLKSGVKNLDRKAVHLAETSIAKGYKDVAEYTQSAAEAATGKAQRDMAEQSVKTAQKQTQAMDREKRKEQADITKADALKQKKLKAAREGRRSLLGG